MGGSWERLYYSLTFLWIVKFDYKEIFRRSPITLDRLPSLPPHFDSGYLFKRFWRHWELEMSRFARGNKPRLWASLLRTFSPIFLPILGVALAYLFLYFSLILILIWLLQGLEEFYARWNLVGIAMLLTVCSLFQNYFAQALEYGMGIVGMKCRVLLTTAIFHRIQTLSYDQVQSISFGHILTIITSDLFKFDETMPILPFIILAPLAILLMVIAISIDIGWPALLILPLFGIHLSISLGIATIISRAYKRALKYSDIRNKHIREFIEGIRLIKCFAWEYAVEATIRRIRRNEVFMVFVNLFFKSLAQTIALVFPLLFIFTIILALYISVLKGELTSSRVFGLVAFMQWYYHFFSVSTVVIIGCGELMVSVARVQQLLQQRPRNHSRDDTHGSQTMIKVTDLSSGRSNSSNILVPVIEHVTFSLQKGSIMSVIGPIGSGKTSLFLSLLNEIVVTLVVHSFCLLLVP